MTFFPCPFGGFLLVGSVLFTITITSGRRAHVRKVSPMNNRNATVNTRVLNVPMIERVDASDASERLAASAAEFDLFPMWSKDDAAWRLRTPNGELSAWMRSLTEAQMTWVGERLIVSTDDTVLLPCAPPRWAK
jgi:hypothetical protein